MSYCHPRWFSDYNYQKLFADQAIYAAVPVPAGQLASVRLLENRRIVDQLLFQLVPTLTSSCPLKKPPRILPAMSPATRDYLENYFKPRISRLERLLDRDLDLWRTR